MKSLLSSQDYSFKGSSRIAIVGAGISGLMSALFLHEAGAKVTLFDKGRVGMEASWAGSGIVSPMYPWNYPDSINELVSITQKKIPHLCDVLTETTGIDPELVKSGLLMLDSKEIPAAKKWCEKYNSKLKITSHKDCNLLEPRLVTNQDNSLWMPDIYQVRNPKLLKSLKDYLELKGVVIHEDCHVNSLWIKNDRVQGIVTKKESFFFDKVVLTTGAWTSKLLPEAKIYPVKGQVILFNTVAGFLKHMVMQDGLYLIPRKDGKILIGSSLEYVGYDKKTTPDIKKELETFAYKLYPELKMFDVELHWAGLRPGKENYVPYICKHPKYDNVFLNAGHFRNGISMSIGSAFKMMDIMQGKTNNKSQYDM